MAVSEEVDEDVCVSLMFWLGISALSEDVDKLSSGDTGPVCASDEPCSLLVSDEDKSEDALSELVSDSVSLSEMPETVSC